MTEECADAVVVGAGHNGLVAANLLADAGWQVLVLEAAEQPGGAVRTAEIAAPGYRSDLCSAFFPMSAASPVFADLDLPRYGLTWRHAPDVLAHVLPDDRSVVLSRDIDRTARSVSAFARHDGAAWRRMYDQWMRLRDPFLDALFRPFPPVRAGARLLRRVGTAEALRLARMVALSARTFTDEWFEGEGARLLVAGNAMHADVGVDNAGSGVFGWLLAMLAQDVGFPVPEGGAGQITAALVGRLKDRGGELRCGRRVDRILIAGGRAVGVRDTEGQPVRARRAVLADVPAPALYLDLVGADHLPARLVDDLGRFHWDPATIKVDWALSGPVPWTAEQVRGAGTVHISADMDGLSAFTLDLARGRTPRDPFLLLGQMAAADPSRSPGGTETVWAYTHVPHRQRWDKAKLARAADRIERVVERHAPGFGGLVVGRAIQGPDDLHDHDPSLVDGAISGGTAAMHQELFLRPVPGLARADTPVQRLFLASASAHPGGAVHGGPGSNAARAALARDGWAGGGYQAVINAAHRLVYG
ncbi:NAD(P)/FAD-dependent oxidoreductase [Kutzneria buriramensis]|uniref:Pyridine nucleotide-disulfide oxidoreductase domain-containing protein 2 n=1 Tax=Kutzneria buriramensis TaxID=1045776 RepID=A0A3E0H761_9PSEU|nr:NAD(P)/FAD-dependent oxidoreductase [Kutzneria buriramensis]REH39291.1 phytoene dehydrogenase-like protein [Kutzneria buriramensis]